MSSAEGFVIRGVKVPLIVEDGYLPGEQFQIEKPLRYEIGRDSFPDDLFIGMIPEDLGEHETLSQWDKRIQNALLTQGIVGDYGWWKDGGYHRY